ncbi:hypothetical protein EV188_103248 [Actinomycetospora succinea]|uniref:Mannosyltransferase PIG-V n=1 Tax=Actinomycetospora succinea TaxID=663603 RepID=A0A4R6VHF3_9PSEU|nr:hypothetical protein [Actinomycetospora succinea]TDQ60746.1 hypothetical protein EV188_103248 [Actinomycetospora succinea]
MTATTTAPDTDATGGEDTARARVARRLPRPSADAVRCALLAIGWQVALTVWGAVLERPLRSLVTGNQGPEPPAFSLLSHTYRFDATWISPIIEGSYVSRPQSAAFYPLFPLLVRGVQLLSFDNLGILAAALIVNTLALWAALCALLAITRHFVREPGRGWFALLALLAAPTAYYLHVFYSEAVFVALAATAYRFALARRWTPMGLCLIPLTTSRVTAIVVLGLCFLEFWRAQGWRRGFLRWPVLWFPAALAGFAAYAAYLGERTGDPWGMFTAYEIEPSWGYTQFEPNVLLTLGRAVGIVARALAGAAPFTNYVLIDQLLPLLAVAVLLAASVYLIVVLRGAGVPLGLYGIATMLMITLNGNLVAVHRYVLPALGIYVALALLAERGGVQRAIALAHLYLGVLVGSVLFAMFTANLWAG